MSLTTQQQSRARQLDILREIAVKVLLLSEKQTQDAQDSLTKIDEERMRLQDIEMGRLVA